TGTTWNDINGATSSILQFNGQPSDDGNTYHAVFTNACGSVTTRDALLSVGAPINLGTPPSNQTGCNGNTTVSFITNANGGNGTVFMTWQYSADGLNWFDIAVTTTTSNLGNYTTTYTFTPTSSQNGYQFRVKYRNGGCTESFSGAATLTVNPVPTADPLGNQAVCNGQGTTAVNFSGTNATTYNWMNNTKGIGVSASGSGNSIPSFTAVNNGTTDVTATISVTPVYTGGNPILSCPGTPVNFTITVKPSPTITLGTNPTVCAGTSSANLPYSAATGNPTTYSIVWSGAATAQGFVNVTNATLPSSPIVLAVPSNATAATYSGTLTISNGSCTKDYPFTSTINPIPTANKPPDQTVCNGQVSSITLTGTPASGVTYSWANNTPSIGLAASGTNTIPSFTATNASSSPITATITITPSYIANGVTCAGTQQSFTITVNPSTVVTNPQNVTVCAGGNATFNVTATGMPP